MKQLQIFDKDGKALHIYAVMFWFKKLFKKREGYIQIDLIVGQSKRGPKNQPIIFESMKDGFEME